MGELVTCVARIVQTEGPVISFQLEVRDEREVIARVYHKLRVIDVERFAKKVAAKTVPGQHKQVFDWNLTSAWRLCGRIK